MLVRVPDEYGRWADAQQFISTAESLGLAPALDMRVVGRVLTHLHEQGTSTNQSCSVNLSAASIADAAWVRELVDMVRTSGVPGNRLMFEISENAAMSNVDAMTTFIDQLRPLGTRFALDDFGTGFSSFYYLKRFAVDCLKINGSFTQDIDGSAENQAFIKAVNSLAHDLNRQVVAKNVETPLMLKHLKEAGTLYGQGNFFQAAVPIDAVTVTRTGKGKRRA